jgi:hypothetical protein
MLADTEHTCRSVGRCRVEVDYDGNGTARRELLLKGNDQDNSAIGAPDLRHRCFGGEYAHVVAIEELNSLHNLRAVNYDAPRLAWFGWIASPGAGAAVEDAVPLLIG